MTTNLWIILILVAVSQSCKGNYCCFPKTFLAEFRFTLPFPVKETTAEVYMDSEEKFFAMHRLVNSWKFIAYYNDSQAIQYVKTPEYSNCLYSSMKIEKGSNPLTLSGCISATNFTEGNWIKRFYNVTITVQIPALPDQSQKVEIHDMLQIGRTLKSKTCTILDIRGGPGSVFYTAKLKKFVPNAPRPKWFPKEGMRKLCK